MRLVVVALTLAASSATLTACGGDDTTEEDRVAAVVAQMQEALRQGRAGEVCAAMTREAKHQIGTIGHGKKPVSCDWDLRVLLKDNEQAAEEGQTLQRGRRPRVLGVQLAPGGAAAVATLSLGGDPYRMRLAKEGGEWKLDDFFGAQGPIQPDLR